MRVKLEFYKNSGKWYMQEEIEIDVDQNEKLSFYSAIDKIRAMRVDGALSPSLYVLATPLYDSEEGHESLSRLIFPIIGVRDAKERIDKWKIAEDYVILSKTDMNIMSGGKFYE